MSALSAPFDGLVETMRPLWEQAVDELDTSVALESEGINDAIAMSRYQVQDVHELAVLVTQQVPARAVSEPREKPTEPVAYLRLASRGLLFAVPGLFYLVVARVDATPIASYVLVVSMLAGWGLSQGVSVVAYRVLGRGTRRCAAIALRRYLLHALVMTVLAISIAAYFDATSLAVMASGQILYVLAATVLLFHSAERLLALSLIPGAIVSIAYLEHFPVTSHVAAGAVGVTIAAALISAWYRATVAARIGDGPTNRPQFGDAVASIPFVLYGLLSGVAVAYIPVRMLGGRPSAGVHQVDLTIVPLVLSMGFAEIELLRVRASGSRLMRRCHELAEYRKGVGRLVARSQLRFLLVLTAASLAIGARIRTTTGINTRDLTLLSAYSALGTALIAALVLVAVNRVQVVLAGFWMTGCLVAIGFALARLAGISTTIEGGYLTTCVILLCCLTALTVRTLRDPIALV